MGVTESSKHDVYTWFEEAMGKERATTLMAMVSPTGWADVATKQDLVLLRTELRGEIAGLRTEMAAEFKQVRTEMAGLRADGKADIEQLRLATKADIEHALRMHTFFTVTTMGVLMGIAVTLARLG